MAFIPDGPNWYLADVVIEVHPEGQSVSRAWINTHLIRADSPDEAYVKAEAIGQGHESSYRNIDGRDVNLTYRGICDLTVVLERLEDGEEIHWIQTEEMSHEEIAALTVPKDELAVFQPVEAESDPRYRPIELGPI